jgi:hypothetical protein
VPTKRSEGQPRSEEQRRSQEQPRSDERSGEVEPTTGAFDSTMLHEDTPSKVRKFLKFNIDSILRGRPAAFQTSRADGGAVVHDSSFPTWVGMKCCKPTFRVDTVHSVRPWIEFRLSFTQVHPGFTQVRLSFTSSTLCCCSASPHAPSPLMRTSARVALLWQRIVWLTCIIMKWVSWNSVVWVCNVENSLGWIRSQHSQRSFLHLVLSDKSFVLRARKFGFWMICTKTGFRMHGIPT